MTYTLDWVRGASVTIDVERRAAPQGGDDDDRCWLQYVPPFRQTMRSPSQELPIALADVRQLVTPRLEKLTEGRLSGARSTGTAAAAAVAPGSAVDQLREVGEAIARSLTLPHVLSALSALGDDGLFLYIGTDEALMSFPLELLHDGQDFLCLKHHVGRYINLSSPPPEAQGSGHRPGKELEELKVLLITVPEPAPREGTTFERLPEAEAERETIMAVLDRPGIAVTSLHGRDARYDDLLAALTRDRYHLIHFSGHATYGGRSSCLSLFDKDVNVGVLTAYLAWQKDAVLCFINGCETARGRPPEDEEGESAWDQQFSMFGLAKAFLDTGAYFLGSSWRIQDESARTFASTFYTELLDKNTPMGRAITLARRATAEVAGDDDPSWASYVFYGDPRVSFVGTGTPDGGPAVEEAPPEAAMRGVDVGEAPVAAAADQTAEGRERLEQIAADYDSVRATMDSGSPRTARMTALVQDAKHTGARLSSTELVEWFGEGGGRRLVAIALIGAARDVAHLDLLADAVADSQSAFEQYHALVGISEMLDDLSAEQRTQARRVLRRASEDSRVIGTDRGYLVDRMLGTLGPGEIAMRPDKLWEPGATVRVGFLDGDDAMQRRVEEIAKEWTEHANLSLRFVDAGQQPEVRVSFERPGVWSYLGTDALAIPMDQPTISLGSAEPDRRSVLRAFGHALGLTNEHQVTDDIPWDRDAVYAFYERDPYRWSREMVEQNVFATDPAYYGFDKELDPASVMLLPISNDLLTEPMDLSGGSELSAGDRELIARLYPADP